MLTVRVGSRRGVTFVELLVVVVVGGVLSTIVANIALRQQRLFASLTQDAALDGQLRDGSAVLPADLRGASLAAGDLREATDTSIEVRETIATSVGCDTVGSSLILPPAANGAGAFFGAVASVQAGDTAWVLSPADSAFTWQARRITDAGSARAGQCLAGAPSLGGASVGAARQFIALDSGPPAATLVGRPIRITRPIRFSVYHASDGNWYLGARDWNSAGARFNTIQPVAGPFTAPNATSPVFRWFDSTGARLATPVTSRVSVGWVQIDLRGRTPQLDLALGSSASSGPRRDSVTIVVASRNRR